MGVIPNVIEKETGIKSINLWLTGTAGIIGYELVLRRYLKYNSPPELIVFYISPSIPNMYDLKTFDKIFYYFRYPNLELFINNWGEYNFLHITSALVTYLNAKFSFIFSGDKDNASKFKELQTSKGYEKNISTGLNQDVKFKSQYIYTEIFLALQMTLEKK